MVKKMTKKKKIYECTNCGNKLNIKVDFIVYSKPYNVVLCKDCYDMPIWYELINQ